MHFHVGSSPSWGKHCQKGSWRLLLSLALLLSSATAVVTGYDIEESSKLRNPLTAVSFSAISPTSTQDDNDETPVPPLESVPDAAATTVSSSSSNRNFISATLGDNMVLQRDVPATLWGFSSEPGAMVTVALLHPMTRAELQERKLNDISTKDANEQEREGDDLLRESHVVVTQLTTRADDTDGTWRMSLPPQAASLTPQVISIRATTGESGQLNNILFGDVYICGGQSNMDFAMPSQTDGAQEAEEAEGNYPHIRLFTVGQGTRSSKPLLDLQTVAQPWSVAGNHSLYHPGHPKWFSAVCWFFGKHVSEGLDNQIPIGLISNSWGGTKVELWQHEGDLFNAMIHPYMMGPMALTGFTWYQGEANSGSQESANTYANHFPTMIEEWRLGFDVPEAYFGFVQLSTWCPSYDSHFVAALRQAQMQAMQLPGKVGYATNADHGDGCNIHPPDKRFCAVRLGNSALALQYGKQIAWRSPTYSKASMFYMYGVPYVEIQLHDITTDQDGLYLLDAPYNQLPPEQLNCTALSEGTCVSSRVFLDYDNDAGGGWVDATLALSEDGNKVILRPTDTSNTTSTTKITRTSYGWGSIPMMTLYDKGTDLPVLGWNEEV